MAQVTVAIPIVDEPRDLAACIGSITEQTEKDIEILCLCSRSVEHDAVSKIAQGFNDGRIVIVPVDGTCRGALINAGIQSAQGDYIGFVEPEDRVLPHGFGFLYQTAVNNDLDVVKSDHLMQKADAGGYQYQAIHKSQIYYGRVFCPIEQMPYYTSNRLSSRIWDGLYRTSFLRENGIQCCACEHRPFKESDFRMQIIAFAKRAMLVDEPFYVHRPDDPAESGQSVLPEYQAAKEFLESHPVVKLSLFAHYCFTKYVDTVRGTGSLPFESRLDAFMRLSEEFKELELMGELNLSVFSDRQMGDVRLLIDSPFNFFVRKAYTDGNSARIRKANKQISQLKEECAELRRSEAYRSGIRQQRLAQLHEELKNRIARKRSDPLFGGEKITVSLVCRQQNYGFLQDVVISLLDQTLPPDRIVVWLPQSVFQDGKKSLQKVLHRHVCRILEFHSCAEDDTEYAHIESMKRYLDDHLIIVRDDEVYGQECFRELAELQKEFRGCVCAHTGWEIRVTRAGRVAPTSTWKKAAGERVSNMRIIPDGAGGIWYPPHCLDERAFMQGELTRIHPFDLGAWLKAMAVFGETKTVLGQHDYSPDLLVGDGICAPRYDECILSIIEEYSTEAFAAAMKVGE